MAAIDVTKNDTNHNHGDHQREEHPPRRSRADKLYHLSIPGFDRVFGPESHRWQRIIWFIGVVTCFYFCVTQIVQHVLVFLGEPVAVRIDYITNSTISVPVFTICPRIFIQNPVFVEFVEAHGIHKERFLDLLDRPEYDVMSLWNMSQVLSENFDCTAHEGSSIINGSYIDSSMFNISELYTTSGKCFKVEATRPLEYRGVNTYIRITDNGPPPNDKVKSRPEALQIYFHSPEMQNVAKYLTGSRGYIIPISSAFAFALDFTEITYCNRTVLHCTSIADHARCLENYIESQIYQLSRSNCRLPYMRVNGSVPLCSSSTEAREMFIATSKVIQDLDSDSVCSRRCNNTIYQNELVSQTTRSNSTMIDVSIYFAYNQFQVATEYESYSFSTLLSDIGGVLGLFLGICLMSLIEVMEVLFFSTRNMCIKDKERI